MCVRYGNVIASRGSVIPLFQAQIGQGGPVTITAAEMTRFLLSLDRAVDTVFAGATAERQATPTCLASPLLTWSTWPGLSSGLAGNVPIVTTGIRPGEKVDEITVSEEEIHRTVG